MHVKTRKLYASIGATSNDAAHLDVQRRSVLRGIQWSITNSTAAPAAGDYVLAELSFSSTAQTATSDTVGVVSMAGGNVNFTTSGNGFGGNHVFHGPTAIPLEQGDRLYLNAAESGGSTWLVSVILHIDEL